MARTVGIGIQDFEKVIKNNCLYVDKTDFIREWWESNDEVTLITRPRRFGKTLNMSMLDYFFSVVYEGRGDLFEGLSVFREEKYRALQGTYPVISLSFALVKETNYKMASYRIRQLLMKLYEKNRFLQTADALSDAEKDYCKHMAADMSEADAPLALHQLSDYLYRYYGKKVIILLDEYDTPMQEAFINGYWEEIVGFTGSLFNSTFKTNPYLERAVMTGITRVSKESIFSDLNNLKVVTTTSDKYATAFGFTQEEVSAALEECGYGDRKELVKRWYDGFIFGAHKGIYNPWSIINFLDTGKIATYWANTSSNGLVGKLIREGNKKIKVSFERLLQGETVCCQIDEQIVYNRLDRNEEAIWSLLVASGYLKVLRVEDENESGSCLPAYELALTNQEVKRMFEYMIHDWFHGPEGTYSDFVEAFLLCDVEMMNVFMNKMALQMFSYFDTGRNPSEEEPERFYHGFVLGLLVELAGEYVLTSNRESGFGRYDIMLEPTEKNKNAYILEFKVFNRRREETLEDTLRAAHAQIREKKYEEALIARGIPAENIRTYGFAFEGKTVLIG